MKRRNLVLPLLLAALAPIRKDADMATHSPPAREQTIPPIDRNAPENVRTATFALG